MNYTTTDQNSKELLNTKYILGFNISTNRKRPIYYKYKGFNEINDVNKELHKVWPLVEFLREGQKVKPYIDYDEKQEYNDSKELYKFQQEGKRQLLKRLLNIFIEALKNNSRAINLLKNVGFDNIALSAITLMELYFGALNKRELTKIKSRLQTMRIVHLNQDISESATALVEGYAKSHGLQIPALLC